MLKKHKEVIVNILSFTFNKVSARSTMEADNTKFILLNEHFLCCVSVRRKHPDNDYSFFQVNTSFLKLKNVEGNWIFFKSQKQSLRAIGQHSIPFLRQRTSYRLTAVHMDDRRFGDFWCHPKCQIEKHSVWNYQVDQLFNRKRRRQIQWYMVFSLYYYRYR